MSTSHRMQIPVFDPDSNEISAKAWVAMVELGRDAAGKKDDGTYNWSEAISASNAILLIYWRTVHCGFF